MAIRLNAHGDACNVQSAPRTPGCYAERTPRRVRKGRFGMVRFLTSGRTVPVWFLVNGMVVVTVLFAGIVLRTVERDNARRELYRQLVNEEIMSGRTGYALDQAREHGLIRFTFAE